MISNFYWLVAPFVALFVAMGLNAFARAVLRKTPVLTSFVIAAGLAGIGMIAAGFAIAVPIAHIVAAALIFAAATEFCLFLITFAMTSISAQICVDLLSGASVSLARAAAAGRHGADLRLARLLDGGLIVREGGGRYLMTARGRRLYGVLGAIGDLLSNHVRRS